MKQTLFDYLRRNEEIDYNDEYIDIFYNTLQEYDKIELIEIIYYCINAINYQNDFQNLINELEDNDIIH